jgi:hypothetical protein
MARISKATIASSLLGVVAILATGCGEMTIRTWVNLDEEESGGYVTLNFGNGQSVDIDVLRLQGGFLTEVTMNTIEVLGPMNGTLVLRDVRMAGEVDGQVGNLCTWNDPEGSSGGTLTINLIDGTTETSLMLDAKATTWMSEVWGMDPMDFEEALDFDLGAGLDLDAFLAAFNSGSAAGLFETSATISSTTDLMGIEAVFNLDLVLTNGAEPPLFDADLLDFCGDEFASQGLGDALFYGINAKSGYLRGLPKDTIQDPLVIPLAEVGAYPGHTLRLSTVGTYSILTLLMDGADTKLGGVFSTTDEVLDPAVLFRIPGAIDVPPNIHTWISIVCVWGICSDWGGDDIPQDFRIDPTRDIVVPAGAQYLVVAPIDGFRNWKDNTGMGFGVSVEVNPE